jgi:hypothetical protein
MSEAYARGHAGGAIRSEGGHDARLRAADGLCLAATPIFGVMAVLSIILSRGAPGILCSAAQHASWLGGMVPMYALMSAFHATPWLRLIGGRDHAAPIRPCQTSGPGSRPAAIVVNRSR